MQTFNCRHISFVKTQINDVILVQKEQNGKATESIDATRLSDGTLRCIAVLAAVMSEPENSLIAIEEIDNGIHPSRVIKLLQAVCQIAAKRNDYWRNRQPIGEMRIWTFDTHLMGYTRTGGLSRRKNK